MKMHLKKTNNFEDEGATRAAIAVFIKIKKKKSCVS